MAPSRNRRTLRRETRIFEGPAQADQEFVDRILASSNLELSQMTSGWTEEDPESTQDDGYENDDISSGEGGPEWDCGFSSSDEVGEEEPPDPSNRDQISVRVLDASESQTMLNTIGPGRYTEGWTDADESVLRAEWLKDPIRKRWWQHVHKRPEPNRSTLILWKVCCRFLRVFPTQIIGPNSHVQFEHDRTIWPAIFCKRLQSLIVHPIFAHDYRLLVLGIMYVAMCKTDHRGPVPWRIPTMDGFLNRFLYEMESNDGSRRIDICRETAIDHWRDAGDQVITSPYYLLFEQIEKKALQVNTESDRIPVSNVTFNVNHEHLRDLWKAANSVEVRGQPAFRLRLSESQRTIANLASATTIPRSWIDLYHLRKNIEIRGRRQCVIDSRRDDAKTSSISPSTVAPIPPASSSQTEAGEQEPSRQINMGTASNVTTPDLPRDQVLELVTRVLGADAADAARAVGRTDGLRQSQGILPSICMKAMKVQPRPSPSIILSKIPVRKPELLPDLSENPIIDLPLRGLLVGRDHSITSDPSKIPHIIRDMEASSMSRYMYDVSSPYLAPYVPLNPVEDDGRDAEESSSNQ